MLCGTVAFVVMHAFTFRTFLSRHPREKRGQLYEIFYAPNTLDILRCDTQRIPDHIGFHHTVELDNTFMDNDFGRAIS